MAISFRKATDRILGAVTLDEIAKAMGKSRDLIAKARLETSSRRTPPAGWERVLGELAGKRARELRAQAEELERLARELEGQGAG